ncbi:MAG: FMN-binding protein [Actinomycetes bacterium]
MSTRATIAAAVASIGVIGLGWNLGSTPATPTAPESTTTTAPASTTTTAGTPSTATARASGLVDGTYTGQTATHRFGSVTVTLTVADGSIATLSEEVISDGDRHSDQINDRAIPTLKSRILSADSADVSTISGATYTTEAYLTSLQSALDEAAA